MKTSPESLPGESADVMLLLGEEKHSQWRCDEVTQLLPLSIPLSVGARTVDLGGTTWRQESSEMTEGGGGTDPHRTKDQIRFMGGMHIVSHLS